MSTEKIPFNLPKHILEQALILLSKEGGWIKGKAQNHKGGYCALGAIWAAEEPYRNIAFSAAVNASHTAHALLEKAAGISSVPSWNDSPVRTKRSVLRAFEKAIKLANEKS